MSSKEPLRYLRTSRLQRLPLGFHVVRRFRVERLNILDVATVTAYTMDATNLQSASPWRVIAITGYRVTMQDGSSRFYTADEYMLSETGGEFFEVAPIENENLRNFDERVRAVQL